MATGDEFIFCGSSIGSEQILRLLTSVDANGKPYLKSNRNSTPPINPPLPLSARTYYNDTLEITFDMAVTSSILGWSAKKNGVNLPLTVAVGAEDVWGFHAGTFSSGDVLTLSYDSTVGDTASLLSVPLASFTDFEVTNVAFTKNAAYQLEIKTDNIGPSADNEFTLPVLTGFGYPCDYFIDKGNGDAIIHMLDDSQPTLTYSAPGTYTISITGTFPGLSFDGTYDKLKAIKHKNWGSIKWKALNVMYRDCTNLTIDCEDYPDLSECTNIAGTFLFCPHVNGDMDYWRVETITNPTYFVGFCDAFNGSMKGWRLILANSLEGFFYSNFVRNKNINSWQLSLNLLNMKFVFFENKLDNNPTYLWGQWMTNVTSVESCYEYNEVRNQVIETWALPNVLTMKRFMAYNYMQNKPVAGIMPASCTNMEAVFYWNYDFDYSFEVWPFEQVTRTRSMCERCLKFSQSVANLNPISLQNADYTFYEAELFNSQFTNWTGTVNLNSMEGFVSKCPSFDQEVHHIYTANVTNFKFFLYSFAAGYAFSKSLALLDISSATSGDDFMGGKDENDYSPALYDELLNGWGSRPVQPNTVWGFGNVKYTVAGQPGRDILTGPPNNNVISDGGLI